MRQKLQELIQVLENTTFLDAEAKKHWFTEAEKMPDELVGILISALSAKNPEDIATVKEKIALRQQELKTYTEEMVHEGIKNIYKEAEAFNANNESNQGEDLLAQLEEQK